MSHACTLLWPSTSQETLRPHTAGRGPAGTLESTGAAPIDTQLATRGSLEACCGPPGAPGSLWESADSAVKDIYVPMFWKQSNTFLNSQCVN